MSSAISKWDIRSKCIYIQLSGGDFFSACMPVMFVADCCEIVPACFRDLFILHSFCEFSTAFGYDGHGMDSSARFRVRKLTNMAPHLKSDINVHQQIR